MTVRIQHGLIGLLLNPGETAQASSSSVGYSQIYPQPPLPGPGPYETVGPSAPSGHYEEILSHPAGEAGPSAPSAEN